MLSLWFAHTLVIARLYFYKKDFKNLEHKDTVATKPSDQYYID